MRSKLLFLSSLFLLLASCTPTYIVTFAGGTGGSVSNMGGEYDEGTTVSVSAQPETGYEFIEWSDGSSQNPRTIVVSQNLNLTALFSKQQFSVSITTQGEGTVATSGATGQGGFEYGSSARFEAVPAAGWAFAGWTGDVESTENPVTVTITEAKEVTATFIRQKFDLNVTIEGEGTVTEELIVQPLQYDYETQVKLTATAEDGWAFAGWTGDVESTENPVTVTITEAKEVTATFQIETYFSINVIGNGTYKRPNSPYPPLEYEIELISGNKNENGDYSKGSIIRLSVKENPGWQFAQYDYSYINDVPGIALNQDIDIIVEDNVEIELNVGAYSYTTERNSDGTFLNVGHNIGAYAEWNEPNSELNFYITENFMYPDYVEAYKDRLFEIRQLLGEWGPLDILIYDWEENPAQNREMFQKTREDRAAAGYQNQIISNIQNWVNVEMERYDKIALEGGYPFGSADSPMGMRKQIGSIFKNKNWDYLKTWAGSAGLEVADLIQTEDFNWEFATGAYHEYIHVWQASQVKHGFINMIGNCYDCNEWTDIDPTLYPIWVAPRWFQEGQCHVIQSLLSEKMELRAEQNMCCSPPRPSFKVRNYIEGLLRALEDGSSSGEKAKRLDRYNEEDVTIISDIASWYKFAKMNYSLETFMAFETHNGAYGYASALQQYLGMSEDEFYTTFNNWFFDSNLSLKEKLDYLYPEGINPIQMNILKRR